MYTVYQAMEKCSQDENIKAVNIKNDLFGEDEISLYFQCGFLYIKWDGIVSDLTKDMLALSFRLIEKRYHRNGV